MWSSMDQEQIYELEIDLLQPNPLQPRGLITPESLSELAESIRSHGVLEPLVVAKTPGMSLKILSNVLLLCLERV